MTAPAANLHEYEIRNRPPRTWQQVLHGIVFSLVFAFGCFMINGTQFLLLPLRLYPDSRARSLYDSSLRFTKGAFGTLLIFINQWFCPTTLKISFARDGPGAYTEQQIQDTIIKDGSGRPIGLNVPKHIVLIANHQMYADWWYIWCLTYYMKMHKDVFITLKKSLKWVPVLGWGMQFFDFIFLARSWAADRHYLASRLATIARQTTDKNIPLTFMFFPEGTLVSKDTRPLSKKYADKMGIDDMMHMLLPRSTGLHYVLRSLSPRLQDLYVLDATIAYPGIPRFGYGQSYYTLRSIFLDGVPPPVVHLQLRLFNVAKSVPIGDVAKSKSTEMLSSTRASSEVEIPEHDRAIFDKWLLDLWRAKDSQVEHYLCTGSLSSSESEASFVDLQLKLQSAGEILDAFCYFLPAIATRLFSLWRRK